MTRWFAPEKKGKDDQPQPRVERTIVAESQPRVDFLQTSRSKGGYVAALAQLYELLDSMVLTEFGSGISGVTEGALVARMGAEQAAKAKGLFLTLSKFHDYASGEKRFLFPPVLRWRALTARATRDAEDFLNTMGVTIRRRVAQGAEGRAPRDAGGEGPTMSQAAQVKALSDKILAEVSKVIVGNTEELKLIMACLFAGGHVLLEGVPGVAKTSMAKALAGALGSSSTASSSRQTSSPQTSWGPTSSTRSSPISR